MHPLPPPPIRYSESCLGCAFDERDAGFSSAVGRLWTNFAATGDPNRRSGEAAGTAAETEAAAAAAGKVAGTAAEKGDEWPEFSATGRNVLLHPQPPFRDAQRMTSEAALGRADACELWDEIAREIGVGEIADETAREVAKGEVAVF